MSTDSGPANPVQMVLQRGHTVDKLSEADLQAIVESIDKVRAERAASGASMPSQQQPPKQPAQPEAEGSKAEDKELEMKNEEKKKEGQKEEASKEEEKKEKTEETKEERRKRLHSRNMRYYRSFLSFNLSMLYRAMHVQASSP